MARISSALLCFAGALAVWLGGCNAPAPNRPPPAPIRIASYEWPGSYWVEVALKKGWFAEAGIAVERINVNDHYFESLDGVVSGRSDTTAFTEFDLVRHVAAGHDLVGVAAVDYSEGAEALVVGPGIHSLKELRGKRVALRRGTYLEYLLDVFAQREGLKINDFELLDRAEPQGLADLQAGTVDAMFAWEPYATQAIEAVGGSRLFSTADLPGLTYSVLAFRRDFVQARPADIKALLRVWERSVHFIRENPNEAAEIVAKAFGEPVGYAKDIMRTDRILDLTDNTRAFSYAAGFESLHGSWRRMNDFMIERGLVERRVDSPKHLDSSFIKALD